MNAHSVPGDVPGGIPEGIPGDEGARSAIGAALGRSPSLLLALACLFWAGNFVVGRALAGAVDPMTLSWARWTTAFLVLLPFAGREIAARAKTLRGRWAFLLLLGVIGPAVSNLCTYVGLTLTSATNAALINAAQPTAILLAMLAFDGERTRLRQIVGVVLSLLGVAAIVARGDPRLLLEFAVNPGDGFIVASVSFWAVYTVLMRRKPAELSGVAFATLLFGIAAVTVLPFHLFAVWRGTALTAPSPEVFAGIAYVGVFPSVLAFLLWNRAVLIAGAGRVAVFSNLTPVFSVVLAAMFLGERLFPFHLAGMALIFAGIAVAAARWRRDAR